MLEQLIYLFIWFILFCLPPSSSGLFTLPQFYPWNKIIQFSIMLRGLWTSRNFLWTFSHGIDHQLECSIDSKRDWRMGENQVLCWCHGVTFSSKPAVTLPPWLQQSFGWILERTSDLVTSLPGSHQKLQQWGQHQFFCPCPPASPSGAFEQVVYTMCLNIAVCTRCFSFY